MDSKAVDAAIIGGGIIGCAIAAHLSSMGADVMLFERNELASGASGRNHGLIWYPQDQRLDALYRESHQQYTRLSQESVLNIALDTEPRGLVILVSVGEHWAVAKAEAEASELGGIKVQRLEREELLKLEPYLQRNHLGGWMIEDGYRLDPSALTLAFALEARAHSAGIATHTDVKQVLIKDGVVQGVATDYGIINSKVVVDAAGPWASKIARSFGGDLNITGARGWLLLTKPVATMAHHLLVSPGWHLPAGDPGPASPTLGGFSLGKEPLPADVGMLLQQMPSGHILVGGSRVTSLSDDPEGTEATREIAQRAVAAMPRLEDVRLASVWSGSRPMSPDGRPQIGWLDGVEGFFVAGGHGGQGVILAGGTARLAAELIMERPPFTDPALFSPNRFR